METQIVHSLKVVLKFVSDLYKMDITIESQKQEIVKGRKMFILLARGNKDGQVAKFLGLSRPTVVNHRKSFKDEMEFNKTLRAEFEQAKRDLLLYEII